MTCGRSVRGEIVTDNADESRRVDTREPLGADFIIPVMASILAGYYIATTTDLVWEARAAGIAVGVPLLLMCFYHMGRTVYRIIKGEGSFGFGEIFENNLFNRQRLGLLILSALFIIALPWTGTTLGLFLVLVASMRLLGVTSIRQLITVAATTAAAVYVLLMYLVSSRLPQGPVEWLIARIFGIGA
jgi:hypothetical protein